METQENQVQVSQMGHISEFNMKTDNLQTWLERYEAYVTLNNISENKRLLLFITLLGNEAYTLLRNLCTPTEPKTKGYEELKKILHNYMNLTPNKRTERFKFKDRKQASTESISQYVAELRRLSQYCQFTDLEDALCDQLLWGIKDRKIRERLLTKEDLTYKTCVEIALSMEMAANEVTQLEKTEAAINYTASNHNRKKSSKTKDQEARGSSAKIKCSCCGKKNHSKDNCYFKDKTCNNCGKTGHISPVCRVKKNDMKVKDIKKKDKSINNIGESEYQGLNIETLNAFFSPHFNYVKPYEIKLQVNNIPITFQKDSGSPISAISELDSKRYSLSKIEIKATDRTFTDYVGNSIKPIGYIRVQVTYNGNTKELNLYIFKNGGPPLVGREWITSLEINRAEDKINNIRIDSMENIFEKYKEVFTDNIGCFKNEKFKLYLKENTKPIFCKPRPLPFTIKEKVTQELLRLKAEGLITPVDSSEWATPIVPIVKPNGTIRLCGDYKVTINPSLITDKFPIPRINDLLASLKGGTKFCKLDLSQAYLQLQLHEESQKLTTISTHLGLFVMNRLPYGIASCPGIFSRVIHNLLINLEGTLSFFDDILIIGKDDVELLNRLQKVLEKLKTVGLTVKTEKCEFFKDKIQFLGYEVSKDGLKIPKSRINALQNIPPPTNVTELKSYLGMVTYYAKFVPNMATIASPLYKLLTKDNKWKWEEKQIQAFNKIKDIILSDKILVHYNPENPLILTCDASPVGISGILSHRFPSGEERPIGFASRSLSKAETNYSQIDREALAIVFAVKYFHQYVYGRQITLRTDNKALSLIFNEKKGLPVMSAQRLQRYAVFLAGYNYKIEHVKGIEIGNVDALSRLPIKSKDAINYEASDNLYINAIFTEIKSLADIDLAKCVQNDKILKEVFIRVYLDKWPINESEVPEELRIYFRKRLELTIEQGCLMWGHRIIIPQSVKELILKELHNTHLGIVKMKSIARSYVYWPQIDADIEKAVKNCKECLSNRDAPPKSILHTWPWPDGPSYRIHLDFAGPLNNTMFIIICDAYSKWLYVSEMKKITSAETIKVLRQYFGTWGIPFSLITDNGTSLCSEEMEAFLKANGVTHIRTPPYHPATNGAAENAVRTFKNFLKKCKPGSDLSLNINKFLLNYNSTPHCTTNTSPAELHIGRKIFTALDRLTPSFRAKNSYLKKLQSNLDNHKGSRNIQFEENATVLVRNYGTGEKYTPGTVMSRLSPVTYVVKTGDNLIKRHTEQLWPDKRVSENVEVDLPGTSDHNNPEIVSHSNMELNKSKLEESSPKELHKSDAGIESCKERNVIPLRRSNRVVKPVNRMNL